MNEEQTRQVTVSAFPIETLRYLQNEAKRQGVVPSEAGALRWAATQYARHLKSATETPA